MATKIEKRDINSMNDRELLDYQAMLNQIITYYDNATKASLGDYDNQTKGVYDDARLKLIKYSKIREFVFNEIEKRVNQLDFETVS